VSRVSRPADALAAAARWRLVALLFERPRGEWAAEVRALAREVQDQALGRAAALATAATEGQYLRLVGPGGFASPREAAYCGLGDPGWALSHLARCYAAFAYAPRTEDPPDHVAVEVGFVAYLHLKEALALAAGDEEAARVTADGRERFVATHLAPLAAGLARELRGAEGHIGVVAAVLAESVPPVEAGIGSRDPLAGACGSCARA
jgi:nitrate reductase assembly molybdenum cofactor insertion protein NarJ